MSKCRPTSGLSVGMLVLDETSPLEAHVLADLDSLVNAVLTKVAKEVAKIDLTSLPISSKVGMVART